MSSPLTRRSRVRDVAGEKGFERLQEAFVVVVGLGGVGSHAAHMLVGCVWACGWAACAAVLGRTILVLSIMS
jgi:hypothetical protein